LFPVYVCHNSLCYIGVHLSKIIKCVYVWVSRINHNIL